MEDEGVKKICLLFWWIRKLPELPNKFPKHKPNISHAYLADNPSPKVSRRALIYKV